jgi:hypothetical protein
VGFLVLRLCPLHFVNEPKPRPGSGIFLAALRSKTRATVGAFHSPKIAKYFRAPKLKLDKKFSLWEQSLQKGRTPPLKGGNLGEGNENTLFISQRGCE